jgi:hypothetical protein
VSRIFISYRRDDSASISGRIYDRLVAKFGRKRIFKDVDDIPAGVDFNAYIRNMLRQCTVALVVIGRRWLDIQDTDGRQRLAQPNDLVRIEIETALSLGLTVIPVLAEGATMPAPPDVPESLRELTRLNALPARIDPDFAHDMDKVISAVEYAIASHTSPDIFRRMSVAMSKRKPSVAIVGDADASLPGISPQLAATPATLPPFTPTRVPTPAHVKRTAATSMTKPLAMVGLSTLVIVTMIAGYFSLQGLGLPLGGPKTTRTALSPTAPIAATPTQEPARLPFRAVSPGPGCDRQNSWAAYYWRLYIGRTTINCPVDKPYTEMRTICFQSNYCQYAVGVVFLLDALPLQSHPHYIVSVQTSRMSSNAEVDFDLSNSSLHLTISASAGHYDASWTENNFYHDIEQGSFDSKITHTFAFDVNGKVVTAMLDGIHIGSRTFSFVPVLGEASMSLSGQVNASADFANFSVVSK